MKTLNIPETMIKGLVESAWRCRKCGMGNSGLKEKCQGCGKRGPKKVKRVEQEACG